MSEDKLLLSYILMVQNCNVKWFMFKGSSYSVRILLTTRSLWGTSLPCYHYDTASPLIGSYPCTEDGSPCISFPHLTDESSRIKLYCLRADQNSGGMDWTVQPSSRQSNRPLCFGRNIVICIKQIFSLYFFVCLGQWGWGSCQGTSGSQKDSLGRWTCHHGNQTTTSRITG